jgi:hypothetical protein
MTYVQTHGTGRQILGGPDRAPARYWTFLTDPYQFDILDVRFWR